MVKYVIRGAQAPLSLDYFRDIITYRDLLWMLAYKEYKVRYAQTFLGFGWAFVQPLLTMVILTTIFGSALKIDTGTVPHPVTVLLALSIWSYFSFVTSQAGRSFIQEQNLVQKVYFPRLILPLSKALVGLVDLGITLLLLVALMAWFRVSLGPGVLLAPMFLALAILLALTCGILVSALTVRYRDVQHILPFLVQFGLYATPVAYPLSAIPEKYRVACFLLNPLAGIVESFRACVVGQPIPWPYVGYSAGITALLLIASISYFRRVELTMADVL